MRKKKTKKKRFDRSFDFFRHPLSVFAHLRFVRLTPFLSSIVCLAAVALAVAPAGGRQNSRDSHGHDFVIFANVFNNQGFALLGARARVRRSDEKKFRWEARSDHQGELGIRVPEGTEYELTIEARGFKTQTRKIDAKQGNRVDLTIRMEP